MLCVVNVTVLEMADCGDNDIARSLQVVIENVKKTVSNGRMEIL